MSEAKVFVLGLDGATFDVIRPLVAQGRLPNFDKLLHQGCWGTLRSTVPPESAVAWPSFMTGVNPGKHGLYYFTERKGHSYAKTLAFADSIKAETLWSILGRNGKTVGVFNMPMTFPPEKVNGFMVSGLMTPGEDSVFTYPATLQTELIRELGDLPFDGGILKFEREGASDLEVVRRLFYEEGKRVEGTMYLMRKHPCDLFVSVLTGLDRVQHRTLRFLDPIVAQKLPPDKQKFRDLTNQCYEYMDGVLGQVMAEIGNDAHLIIVSDHGFAMNHKVFHVNRFLQDLGLLKLKPLAGFRRRKLCLRKKSIGELLAAAGMNRLAGILPAPISRVRLPILWTRHARFEELIDWRRTRAWYDVRQAVHLNVAGREPKGIVKPGAEYEALRDLVIRKLMELADPKTSEKVVEHVHRREELYWGERLDDAPDLVVVMKEYACHVDEGLFEDAAIKDWPIWMSTFHKPNGIFLMRGPGVPEGAMLDDLSIMDVAPTILCLLGCRIPRHMDGKPILALLKAGAQREALYEESETHAPGNLAGEARTTGEEAAVRRTLQGLGYI